MSIYRHAPTLPPEPVEEDPHMRFKRWLQQQTLLVYAMYYGVSVVLGGLNGWWPSVWLVCASFIVVVAAASLFAGRLQYLKRRAAEYGRAKV